MNEKDRRKFFQVLIVSVLTNFERIIHEIADLTFLSLVISQNALRALIFKIFHDVLHSFRSLYSLCGGAVIQSEAESPSEIRQCPCAHYDRYICYQKSLQNVKTSVILESIF